MEVRRTLLHGCPDLSDSPSSWASASARRAGRPWRRSREGTPEEPGPARSRASHSSLPTPSQSMRNTAPNQARSVIFRQSILHRTAQVKMALRRVKEIQLT